MNKVLPLLLSIWIIQPAACQPADHMRKKMVRNQIEARGITHKPTLQAMKKVERHLFVPDRYRDQAYDDTALPINYGQTISQPFIVAKMTELINPSATDRVLEIGTGSGYQAAVLAEIVDQVYTMEIVSQLGEEAKKTLSKLGYDNIEVIIDDGFDGLSEKAPFDAIIVTAAPETVPPALIRQLKEGGRMVIPVGPGSAVQKLTLIQKLKGKVVTKKVIDVRFVPLTRKNK